MRGQIAVKSRQQNKQMKTTTTAAIPVASGRATIRHMKSMPKHDPATLRLRAREKPAPRITTHA
eukprot:366307-Chlamydomonas_euryale.AAC.8